MNKETEDKLSKVLHNAIEKALNDNQDILDEEKKLDEQLRKTRKEIAQKPGNQYMLSIKPMTHNNFNEFYGEDYYNFGKGQKARPYKKGEFYVRYTNEYLNESTLNYPKPQKIEKIIDNFKILGLTKYNFDIPNIKDSNDVYGYVLIALQKSILRNGVLDIVKGNMHDLGYFQATETPAFYFAHPVFGEVEIYQFEPYYYNDYKLTINDQLLHVSPIWNKESILKNGFIAGCKNKKFQYPPRNYFFNKLIREAVACLFYDGEIFKGNKGRNEYVKFFMDTNKLMENRIKFYSDPNFAEECAVYTYESIIHPTYIKKVEHDLI